MCGLELVRSVGVPQNTLSAHPVVLNGRTSKTKALCRKSGGFHGASVSTLTEL